MVLQWSLFFMYICIKVTPTEASSWTAAVPSSVKGLLGSCVVIPCSYNYPEPQKSPQTFTGIWYNNDNQVICHSDASQTPAQFWSRTKLLGDLSKKNCSLMIDKLTRRDEGTFHFRIIMEAYTVFSYSKNKISVSVIDEPNPTDFSVQEEVKEGQTVSASCSVFHSCPTYPPSFHWSHSGEQHFQAQKLHDGQWKATSILMFRSNRTDHNKLLQCRVTYHGGKHQETSKTLKVQYAPVNVKVEYQSVNEGETAHLKCSSDANPVSSYEWHSETGALLNKGQTYTMSNVSRHSIESVYCTAVNEEGQDRSSTMKLNVLYPPDIRTSSKCFSEDDVVKCECIVESRPPSMVHFVLGDRVLQSTSIETVGSVTTGTLQTDFGSFKFVHCLANNTLGNANLTFLLPATDNMQNIFIASGAGVIVLIILIATGVGVVRKWGRSGETPTSDLGTMKAERPVELPRYAPTKRKEDRKDMSCSDIYANDHLYGNTDCDESIYNNV
ncbi:myelin-associated glycoprotein-like isoform X2 [Astatotilapia calliptera]|uniref:myelin-associated glycoprotein-like isoform X2 n=1 Tax=Astatotilapia calliptera TaxID=8154 RepID=UPI000E40887B|nr:myelin-associated glycoprotein-like isoform X2 [Astatotilapia calliptera]